MMKGKKKRLLAGTLALLLSCSTLLNVPFENLEIIFQWNVPGTEYSVKLPEEYFNYHQIEPKQFLAELISR